MKARRVKKLEPGESLAENAARIVVVRLDEMRSLAPKALRPECVKQQHDMRIAAKRLRYVLEATELCFGRTGEVARRRARELQGVLGELHDCDVMLPRVEGHLGDLRDADADAVRRRAGEAYDLDPALAARAPHRTSYRGLETLMVYLQARRRLLFDRFREFRTRSAPEAGTGSNGPPSAASRRGASAATPRSGPSARGGSSRRPSARNGRPHCAPRRRPRSSGVRGGPLAVPETTPLPQRQPTTQPQRQAAPAQQRQQATPPPRPAAPAARPPAGVEAREVERSNTGEVPRGDGG